MAEADPAASHHRATKAKEIQKRKASSFPLLRMCFGSDFVLFLILPTCHLPTFNHKATFSSKGGWERLAPHCPTMYLVKPQLVTKCKEKIDTGSNCHPGSQVSCALVCVLLTAHRTDSLLHRGDSLKHHSTTGSNPQFKISGWH